MKRLMILVLCVAVLISSTACAASATESTPSTEATPSASEVATPSPTEQPTPTPEPVSELIQRFSADPRQFIIDAVCEQQIEMIPFLSDEISVSSYDTTSPDLIHFFSYENFNEIYDDTTGLSDISNESASYGIGLQFANADIDYSDDFNYQVLADEVGIPLDLAFGDETITIYSSDGTEKRIVQKWAQGSEDSYSAFWIYVDSSYTAEGTALFTYAYPGQNESLNTLAEDSFEMAALPFVSVLASYKQTSSVGYSPNYTQGDVGPALGNVGMSWWNVTEEDIRQLAVGFSADPNVSVMMDDDSFHWYSIAVNSDYFSSISLEYYDYSSGMSAEPSYRVNCTIYF